MKMRFVLFLSGGVLSSAACGYGFDPDIDHFACESNDDCGDGYVCGGQTLNGRDVIAYCVSAEQAVLGVHLATSDIGFRVDGQAGKTCDYKDTADRTGKVPGYTVWMSTSASAGAAFATDPEAASLTPVPHDQCVGGVASTGRLSLLCRQSLGAGPAPKAAAMWVAIHDAEEPGDDPSDWWVLVAGSADLPSAAPFSVAPNVPAFDWNIDADAAACDQALRTRSCGTAGTPPTVACVGCATATVVTGISCPAGFECTGDALAGTACTRRRP
ncbi:MAG: hypothetical protein HY903_24790 [Deltaproteobacteria bacterium]|nr:hypothetical protein [Deltaproteobacteria bacterium]